MYIMFIALYMAYTCTLRRLLTVAAMFLYDNQMSLVVRRPVFGVSDLARHKSGCTAAENG